MKCKYCERELSNNGSLTIHENSCQLNPNRVQRKRSPNAGVKKGTPSPLRGVTKPEETLRHVIETVESGKLLNYSEPGARRIAKKYLTHKHGNTCSVCNTTEWMGHPVPLVCDHISGDSSDNEINNFRLVCCNCDAQLPTFKSKNRGKGRQYDREYRQRKSNNSE
jgi:hypothetical protein